LARPFCPRPVSLYLGFWALSIKVDRASPSLAVRQMEREPVASDTQDSWLVRHEFLVRRLHSLSGLIPVGAYMVVHLLVNASVQNGPGTFQEAVYQIHSLGRLLPFVEWTFIFIPILFHAIFGVVIIAGGLPNTGQYPTASNIRYTLQRVTGILAFLFIVWHVFHMHGWIHADWWIDGVAKNLGGAKFRPFNAASSAGLALQSFAVIVGYVIGVLACVFHLANGIWTMGITWGVWTSPAAQRRANWVCTAFGIGLAVVSLAALQGMWASGHGEGLQESLVVEDKQYEAGIDSGRLQANEHKRSGPEERGEVGDEVTARPSD